jgi:uroporphyrinogen III methyltransferase/synthase
MKDKPLTGKRILITRPREQSAAFADRLRDLGAEVIEFPMIEVVPPLRWDRLDEAIDRLASYDWIIFTSINGVHFFWQRLMGRKKEALLPSSLKVCAIGPATARGLKERGIRVDYTPKEYVAEAILQGFESRAIQGKRILLARAKKARDVLPKGLRKMGAEVDVVEAYRTIKPGGGSKRLKEILAQGRVDVISFTSSSTVDHFVDLLKDQDLKRLLRGVAIACIGPVTSRSARDRGMTVHIQPREYTIPGLTQAIVEYVQDKDLQELSAGTSRRAGKRR